MYAVRLTHNQALWGMVLAPFLWGTAGVVTRQLESAEGFEVTFWRLLTNELMGWRDRRGTPRIQTVSSENRLI